MKITATVSTLIALSGICAASGSEHNDNKGRSKVRTLLRSPTKARGLSEADKNFHDTLQRSLAPKKCSPVGVKAVGCGARDTSGKAYDCCEGLVCGGTRNRVCVYPPGTEGVANRADAGLPSGAQLSYRINADDSETYDNIPTYEEGDHSLGFLWRLYFEQDIKWEPRGYDFCVMCRGKKCEKGDYVVTSHCNGNAPHFRWEWVEVEGQEGVGLMKTKSEMLCLEPNEDILKQHTLQPCDATNTRQHFKGINFADKFQLYPVINQRGKPRCMTMLHHPLAANDVDGEMIIDQPCYKAQNTHTALWLAEYRAPIEEKLVRAGKCSERKCKECEGFCSDDSDCAGELFCYKRGEKGWRTNLENKYDPNPWAKVPGCSGVGQFGKNYCSKQKYESPYSDKEIQEILDAN